MSQVSKDIVVFIIRRDTKCTECKREIWRHDFIYLENRQPLCLSCADLDHLEFLPSGDPCVTRRAKKYSKITTVVVEWSRTRKRYERQGILVEPDGIEKAMESCMADADLRKALREREATKRAEIDKNYIQKFANQIRQLFPECPDSEADKIAEHACRKYSGRVGRSAAAKDFDPQSIFLAVQAHIRHTHTNYDELLMMGWDRFMARDEVREQVEMILDKWKEVEEIV